MVFDLYNFNALQLHQKATFLDKQSVFLINLYENEFSYSLYAHKGYYLEVIIDSESRNLIDIVAFKDWDRLDKYLDNILLVGELFE
ncbi:MAG: hypothetical protein K0S33_447 [Bacteroidetes bacterium]|jgi:hypothetical protein|nr:hypothetical protein [Bacteroidota bacterium]